MRLGRAFSADELIQKCAQPAFAYLLRIDLANRARRGVALITLERGTPTLGIRTLAWDDEDWPTVK